MTKGEMRLRLEALLDRVRARTAQPRRPPAVRAEARADEVPSVARGGAGASRGETSSAEHGAEEAPASDVRDSRERLVAAEVALPEPERAAPALRVQESVPPIDVAEIEVSEDEVAEPPSSSRRPVAPEPEERIAQIAFGAEEPREPLHTPPPESGRLPSAAADFEEDLDAGGVRSPTPLLPRRGHEPAPRELVPEAIRPQMVPSDAVAEVIAEAQRFSPATFVALLDASLGL